MALVVEDGTGKTNADSYISLADANTYDAAYVVDSNWATATDGNKEIALRKGTQYLDARYQGAWRGQRSNETQALAWPRTGVIDDDGFGLDADEMPVNLKRAAVEAAFRSLAEELLPNPDEGGDIKKEKTRVGPIIDEIEYVGSKDPVKDYPKVMDLIKGLIYGGDRIIKG